MASILTVGPSGQFNSIQAAIDAASAGDTIQVEAGTYSEQLVIDGKSNLTIEAAAGENVIVEMVASPVFTATAAEANGRDRTAVVTIKDSTGITVHGIEVDGNGLANAMASGKIPTSKASSF
jgi:pectin methylesterase-like acyl-CoA thioesterase